jgi:hypothetical protein
MWVHAVALLVAIRLDVLDEPACDEERERFEQLSFAVVCSHGFDSFERLSQGDVAALLPFVRAVRGLRVGATSDAWASGGAPSLS